MNDVSKILVTIIAVNKLVKTPNPNVRANPFTTEVVKIYNTPDALTLAVAELTIGLMINLLRKVRLMDGEVRAGEWKKEMGNLLSIKYMPE